MTCAPPATSRGQYLAEIAELLWPAPARVTAGARNGSRVVSEFFVLPDLANARLVLPLHARRAAASIARRYTEPRSRSRRARACAMSLAVASGAAQAMFRHRLRIEVPANHPGDPLDTIETLLRDVVGAPIAVGLHVTRPRANRKPILQALTADGTLRAVAKVATDHLTRSLVTAEEDALRHLAARRTRTFTAPRVLHLTTWRGLDVLTLSALPAGAARVPAEHNRLAAVAGEIAATSATAVTTVAHSRYVDLLRTRIGRLRRDAADRLQSTLDRVLAEQGQRRLPFGAWHGDFTGSNLAVLRDDVLVWDWERYAAGVPLGYDLVHHEVQQHLLAPGLDIAGYVHGLPARAPALLAPLGLDHLEAVAATKLYLVEITVRYVEDRQDELGMLSTRLPVLLDTLADL